MAELAVDVHNRLEAYGLDVFYDKESGVGEWQKILRQQLILREYFIVLLAPETLWEAQGVRSEVSWALAEGKTIIPLRVTGFAITQEIVPPEFAGVFKYYAIPLDPNNLDEAIAQIAKSLGVHVESKQPAKQNRIARFLSSQSWQGISAIIGIIGIIIAVIALNPSNQSTANTTLMPQLSTVAVVPSATSAPADLPTSTPSTAPSHTSTPEITATNQLKATSALPPTFSVSVPADVNVRTGPGYSFPILLNTRQGTRYDVIGKFDSSDGLWFQVELSDGQLGWIVSSVVTLLKNGEAVVASQFESVAAEIPIATSTATYTPSITPTNVPTNTATHTPQPTDVPTATNTLTPTNPSPVPPDSILVACQGTIIQGNSASTAIKVYAAPPPGSLTVQQQYPTVRVGTQVLIVDTRETISEGRWHRIAELNSTGIGWISAEFIQLNSSCT